ncbi:hypothetical protein BJ875DRAFT_519456 [Amylocarpus encephaloides]|uniref:RBR-type E3 ubiquitin transferase n=1 Tax=Amylocarpus encephaloides TaxID=45428 RepID=A0A9P7YTM3_9HELO|nr:hypothetical protein BJ875DRAFT_519456 [Amylocarpus encephaloides]
MRLRSSTKAKTTPSKPRPLNPSKMKANHDPFAASGLPAEILTLPCRAHRAEKIFVVLSLYKIQFPRYASKVEHVKALFRLSAAISEGEQVALGSWLSGRSGGTTADLARAIAEARARDLKLRSRERVAESEEGSVEEESVVTCAFCKVALPVARFPGEGIHEGCEEGNEVCLRCLEKAIDAQIVKKPWELVMCVKCTGTLEEDDLKAFAGLEAFELYKIHHHPTHTSTHPSLTFCASPSCISSQLHFPSTNPSGPLMSCHACGFHTCSHHQRPYHHGLSCEEYDALPDVRMAEKISLLDAEYLERVARECGCGVWLMKDEDEDGGGCDVLTCPRCTTSLCWLCAASSKTYHSQAGLPHLGNCSHYVAPEPPKKVVKLRLTSKNIGGGKRGSGRASGIGKGGSGRVGGVGKTKSKGREMCEKRMGMDRGCKMKYEMGENGKGKWGTKRKALLHSE